MTHTGLVARVLIDSPLPQLDHLFDYSIPAELEAIALPGVRVKVPFRAGRIADGYLIEVIDTAVTASSVTASSVTATAVDSTDDSALGSAIAGQGLLDPGAKVVPDAGAAFSGKLSPLDSVVSPVQVLTPEVAKLARALADRAAGNASDVIRLAVPNRQVRAEKAWLAAREAASAATAAASAASVSQGSPVFASADALPTGKNGRPMNLVRLLRGRIRFSSIRFSSIRCRICLGRSNLDGSPIFASGRGVRTSKNRRTMNLG